MSQKQPYKFHAEPERIYSWCSCGFSGIDPLCDGSHREQTDGKRSVKFNVDEAKDVWLCGCKQTKTPPYCDGSHKQL